MSELKAINLNSMGCYNINEPIYLKSEADKVIAELEKKYFNDLQDAEDSFKSVLELNSKELHHNKYKRCLAMAKWCEAELFAYPPFGTESPKEKWWQKWRNRWLELAEKFKES